MEQFVRRTFCALCCTFVLLQKKNMCTMCILQTCSTHGNKGMGCTLIFTSNEAPHRVDIFQSLAGNISCCLLQDGDIPGLRIIMIDVPENGQVEFRFVQTVDDDMARSSAYLLLFDVFICQVAAATCTTTSCPKFNVRCVT